METQVLDEKDKAQRLQTELDVSEQVQKDFVKLSQTLQVITALHSQKETKKNSDENVSAAIRFFL